MEKNSFLIYNDIIYNLYSCETADDLRNNFLVPLKMLIPYSYSSILFANMENDPRNLYQGSPICFPETFTEAENNYIMHYDEDPLLWLIYGKESALIRESDVLTEQSRLNSPLNRHCYQNYNISDTLQFSIVYQQQFLGVLTLFRTKIDGIFTDNDMFYLRSIGMHLNAVFHRIAEGKADSSSREKSENLQRLSAQYHLTSRECEILNLLFEYKNNIEIAEQLQISNNTIQKHLQNIYCKMNVTSKWDLLRFIG